MGNILGRPQIFYISYATPPPAYSESDELGDDYSSTYDSYDDSYAPYGWAQFIPDLCCYPWTSDYEGYDDSAWDGAVVGVVRRKGCVRNPPASFFLPLSPAFLPLLPTFMSTIVPTR